MHTPNRITQYTGNPAKEKAYRSVYLCSSEPGHYSRTLLRFDTDPWNDKIPTGKGGGNKGEGKHISHPGWRLAEFPTAPVP